MGRHRLLPFALSGLASLALAQDVDEAAVRARLPTERSCIERQAADIAQWTRLLGETERQLNSASSAAARTEAARAVTVLESRIRDSAESLAACVPAGEPELPLEEEPAAPVLAPLSVHLRAGEPVREGGAGQLDTVAVHRALLGLGRGFDACYEALAARHAIVRGQASLHFVVRGDGAVEHPHIEGLSAGDATFQRCVHQAVVHITSPGRPRGGEARLAVPLTLGPEG